MATRLSKYDKYLRPKQTFTDRINEDKEAILDQLNGYEQVENLKQVALGTHIRYFISMKDGTRKFRLGGILINSKGLPKYIVLSAKNKTWSVQTKNTIFFRQLSNNEIIDIYQEQVDDLEFKIKSLKNLIVDLKKDITSKDKIITKLQKKFNLYDL